MLFLIEPHAHSFSFVMMIMTCVFYMDACVLLSLLSLTLTNLCTNHITKNSPVLLLPTVPVLVIMYWICNWLKNNVLTDSSQLIYFTESWFRSTNLYQLIVSDSNSQTITFSLSLTPLSPPHKPQCLLKRVCPKVLQRWLVMNGANFGVKLLLDKTCNCLTSN